MERTLLKEEIAKSYKSVLGYEPSIALLNMLLRGERKPNPDVRFDLHQRGIIPFTAWLDIKAYLNGSSKKENITSPQEKHQENTKAVL